ncbi:MAG: hypothetical protein LBG19_00450 [Prevotellaceae bacterium]|jgi:hypothetical protein|nr:hypothetical protein [Prevotellaceae bacterium]
MMKKKIDAYTITELLVVLLISMLVIACILQLFTYANISTVSMLRKQDHQREVIRCISYLQLNAKRSESIAYYDDRIVFVFSHNPYRHLNLAPELLITQEEIQDTLQISCTILDTVSMANSSLLLMNVSIETKQKKYSTTIYKQYNRDYLINQLERREYFSEPVTQ